MDELFELLYVHRTLSMVYLMYGPEYIYACLWVEVEVPHGTSGTVVMPAEYATYGFSACPKRAKCGSLSFLRVSQGRRMTISYRSRLVYFLSEPAKSWQNISPSRRCRDAEGSGL